MAASGEVLEVSGLKYKSKKINPFFFQILSKSFSEADEDTKILRVVYEMRTSFREVRLKAWLRAGLTSL